VGADFASIVALEAALDRLLLEAPVGEPFDPSVLDCARQWSAAVWGSAVALGPAPLSPAAIERGLTLAARPVFICGTHRSGTTLLANLLDGHPALAVLPAEGTFYTHLERRLAGLGPREQAKEMGQEWLRRLANPSNQPPYWVLGRSTSQASPYVEFVRRFAAWWPVLVAPRSANRSLAPLVAVALAWASRAGDALPAETERWVEKTPTNERHLARLLAEFPEAKVVHVVRRPEDALVSHKAALGTQWRAGREALAIYRNLARSLRVAHAQSRAPSDCYLLVRYEDLVTRPDEMSRRLAGFLGIAALPSLQQPTVAAMPVRANSSFASDRARSEHALTPLERAILKLTCGTAAAGLGYD